jgi:hypothetical protein
MVVEKEDAAGARTGSKCVKKNTPHDQKSPEKNLKEAAKYF